MVKVKNKTLFILLVFFVLTLSSLIANDLSVNKKQVVNAANAKQVKAKHIKKAKKILRKKVALLNKKKKVSSTRQSHQKVTLRRQGTLKLNQISQQLRSINQLIEKQRDTRTLSRSIYSSLTDTLTQRPIHTRPLKINGSGGVSTFVDVKPIDPPKDPPTFVDVKPIDPPKGLPTQIGIKPIGDDDDDDDDDDSGGEDLPPPPPDNDDPITEEDLIDIQEFVSTADPHHQEAITSITNANSNTRAPTSVVGRFLRQDAQQRMTQRMVVRFRNRLIDKRQ